ncbi:MAG TPA: nucleotide exchange factor GrpE [Phycisphaerae bacterium]|nr:nucleotide exchange factor GrpE [Phycisphaerae bacterium]
MTPGATDPVPRPGKGEGRDDAKPAPSAETPRDASPAVGGGTPEDAERQRLELVDKLQRLAAEFSNYQKRAQRRLHDERRDAVAGFVLDLLPVIDNFERAIAAAEATPDFDGLLKGVHLVHDQLLAALGKHGITPIEAADGVFDPEHHEAVAHLPSDEHPRGHVMGEMQKGYRFADRTLRASRVAVSRGKADDDPDRQEPPAEDDDATDAAEPPTGED